MLLYEHVRLLAAATCCQRDAVQLSRLCFLRSAGLDQVVHLAQVCDVLENQTCRQAKAHRQLQCSQQQQ
jgi:hypothetical protein